MLYTSFNGTAHITSGLLMKKVLPPTDDFISEAVGIAIAKREPACAPSDFTGQQKTLYEATVEAYREPAATTTEAHSPKPRSKTASLFSALGLF
ncbi:MAG: hypothetical protein PHD48_10695, partial [Alphaproteobacteria bacterium]|nr:hypothetical protein [Alphaproteobacteria bacterium]